MLNNIIAFTNYNTADDNSNQSVFIYQKNDSNNDGISNDDNDNNKNNSTSQFGKGRMQTFVFAMIVLLIKELLHI